MPKYNNYYLNCIVLYYTGIAIDTLAINILTYTVCRKRDARVLGFDSGD